jgi:effector-binding domain-containing protein
VSKKPAGRYAAYQFSGPSKPAPSEAAAKKLLAWVASKNLPVSGMPIYAYYNPPWTPGFMRRNEVLLLLVTEMRAHP